MALIQGPSADKRILVKPSGRFWVEIFLDAEFGPLLKPRIETLEAHKTLKREKPPKTR